MKQLITLCLFLSFSAVMSGCALSPPSGGSYSESIQPGKTPVFFTDAELNEANSAIIYFDAKKEDSGLFARNGKLLAVKVDGVMLKGATSGMFVSGYQAIAIKPGRHVVNYCYVGTAPLGSVTNCNLNANTTFLMGAKYWIKFDTNTTNRNGPQGNESVLNIRVSMEKINPETLGVKAE